MGDQESRITEISIHALLAEGDMYNPHSRALSLISIHALLAEGDHITLKDVSVIVGFLSTPSLRRATGTVERAARQPSISIHALLAEGDRHAPGPQHQ